MPLIALTVLTVLSGFFVRWSESWSLLYKANLFLHPLIGFLWAAGLLRALWRQQRALTLKMLVVLGLGVAAAAITTDALPFRVAAVLCGLLVVWSAARLGLKRLVRPAGVDELLQFLFLLGVLLLTASGLLIVLVRVGQELRPVFAMHGVAGTALVIVLAAMLLTGRLRSAAGAGDLLATRTGLGRCPRVSEVSALVVAAVAVAALWALDRSEEGVSYTFHLNTVPLEKRKPHEKDEIPRDFPHAPLMAAVETCGGGRGCHAGIVEDHLRSSHNRSIKTSYFQTNLEFMATEVGEQNTYICAGCHFPNAFFLNDTGFRDYVKNDGWSCVYCHAVEEVVFTKEKGRTILKLEPNVPHLEMFSPVGGTDRIKPWDELMIQLNPQGHARVFRRDLYFQDQYCQVCHNLQIKPSENVGFMKANCIGCHMQARKWMGKEGEERNHFFPGTNLAGPADLGDTEAMRINTMYSRGELELPLRGWGGIWSLIPKEERKIKDIWLLVSIEPLAKAVPGEPFSFRVVTTNTSLDHAFPAAPLDLIEVWLETRVTDARGQVVFESGALDKRRMIPPETHKLGGYMIGMDNHLVTKNRVWQIKQKVIEREIRVNEQVQDRFDFTLPADARGPYEIYASWNYRKLSQEFVDWAYNNSGMTVPLLRVAEVNLRLDPAASGPFVAQR